MKKIPANSRLFAIVFLMVTSATGSMAQAPASDTTTVRKDSVVALKGIVVQSQKQFIEQSAGKLTLNIQSSPLAAGGTAWDALLKAPGMTEQQDNLQFRGKNIQVLVNGRPSNLSGEELKAMLSATQSAGIEKIEILSNPSAGYDAQGTVVVNIKLAKNKNLGTNGIVNAGVGVGNFGRYNAGISVNHRTARVNLYGSYDRADLKQYTRSRSSRLLSPSKGLTDNEYSLLGRGSHSYKAGIDVDLNKWNNFSISVRGMNTDRSKNADNLALIDDTGNGADSSSTVNTQSKIRVFNPSVNLYYRAAFGSKGRELVVNTDYFSYHKNWNDLFNTQYLDESSQPYLPDYLLSNNSVADIRVWAASADYTHPLTRGMLKAGIKSTFTTTDNDARWVYQQGGEWKNDAGKTNHFVFQENINAAYVSYSSSVKKFSYEAGVRAEQTSTSGKSRTLNNTRKNDYLNLFPTLAINYNASATHQFGLSYRRSITRFGFDIVNPFVTYISQYRYSQGNPNVRPGFTNSVEMSHTFKSKLISSINYSRFTDVLAPVFKKAPDSDAVISTQENLNSASQLTGSMTYVAQLFKGKWMMNNTVGALYANLQDNTGAGAGSTTFGVYVSHMNMITLRNGWSAELTASYVSPLTIGVLHVKGQGLGNIGISKQVLKKNGKLTLNLTDVFNTQQQRYSVSSFGVSSTNIAKTESRVLKLAFTYKFGNKNVKAGKQRQTAIEDLKKRTEAN